MNRFRTFIRTHWETLIFGTFFAVGLVLAIGTTQQHDEAMQARAVREARR